MPNNEVTLVVEGDESEIVAFVAFSTTVITALYVAVGHQQRGIGTMLLDYVKARATSELRLFTFARNTVARRFYESQGFEAVQEGFEAHWQLADIEYRWRPSGPSSPGKSR